MINVKKESFEKRYFTFLVKDYPISQQYVFEYWHPWCWELQPNKTKFTEEDPYLKKKRFIQEAKEKWIKENQETLKDIKVEEFK